MYLNEVLYFANKWKIKLPRDHFSTHYCPPSPLPLDRSWLQTFLNNFNIIILQETQEKQETELNSAAFCIFDSSESDTESESDSEEEMSDQEENDINIDELFSS